jgi:predicted ATPase
MAFTRARKAEESKERSTACGDTQSVRPAACARNTRGVPCAAPQWLRCAARALQYGALVTSSPSSLLAASVATPKRIVITGGPGAGKTAVLELARRDLCKHVEVLPESARIVFGGGFPRRDDERGRRGAQRAIFHVQDELERMGAESPAVTTLLCDRGTLDGLAYWPGSPDEFFGPLGTTLEKELARYAAVIHLRVPDGHNGYKKDTLRRESVGQASEIDARLVDVWAAHPHRVFVESNADFVRKAQRALAAIRAEVTCCALPAPRTT